MPRLIVKQSQEDIQQALEDLRGIKDGFVRAYARALNTAATGTQTDMVNLARDDYTYKVAAVKKRMYLKRASWSDLTSYIRSKGNEVHLTDMLGTKQTRTGVSVDVKRSTGRQLIEHAFINRARNSGKMIVFRRAVIGERFSPTTAYAMQLSAAVQAGQINPQGRVWRRPAVALYAPHPEIVWNTADNWAKLQDSADVRLKAAFTDEVDGVIRQYG